MKAAVYLRRSTDRQEQSIDDQRRAIEEYAAREGYDLVCEYLDDAISGATTDGRKSFLRMISDAQAGPSWRYVLVYDVSRFGRVENDEAGHYRHFLSKAGVEVVYTAESLHGDDTDDLVLATKQWMASRYVKDLSRVTVRGLVSKAKRGRWCGGRPPYGYDLLYLDVADHPLHVVRYLASGDREIRSADGAVVTRIIPMGQPLPSGKDRAQLVPGDTERVAVVARIFEMYVHGQLGLGTIAARLNAERIPSPGRPRKDGPSAGRWSPITIRDIIANPAYRGAVVWNRRSYGKFNRVQDGHAVARAKSRRHKADANDPKEWITVEGQHTALVEPELWKRAQREREARAGTTTADQLRAGRGNSRYLLTGLVRCSRCGSRWQGRKTAKGRKKPGQKRIATYHYCCGGYIRQGTSTCERRLIGQSDLEATVVRMAEEHLHEFISTGGAEALATFVREEGSDTVSEEGALRARVNADRARLEELVACLTPDLVPTLEPKIVGLRRQVEDGEARLGDIERFRVSQEEARQWVEELVREAAAIGDVMRSGTLAERKAILRGLTQEIVLDPVSGTGEVALYRIPGVGAPTTTAQSGDRAVVSSLVAGARLEPPT